MVELKTLKEMNYHCGCSAGTELYTSKEDLREEAIKWIKALDSAVTDEAIKELKPFEHSVVVWIKHFFNLSEKDLEEK